MTAAADNKVLRCIGDYELLVKIGEGGMGTVYKGRHRPTGQIVALKLVPADVVSDKILIKRFEKEFSSAKALDHPNIVRALDYKASQEEALLVMEFVDGISLGEKLEREGPLSEAEAILIIAQVAQGLHYAHQRGLIHRDVKPDNILMTPEGQAKLADLGLAKQMDASQALTCTGRALGTPHFMAPEQFRSARSADVRSDVFSLAATLYIMVTGQLPFKAKGPVATFTKMAKNDLISPRKLTPGLSEHVDRVIRKALNSDPQARPASCREFLHELLGGDSASAGAKAGKTELDLWYVDYVDKHGETQVAVGTTQNLRRSLQNRLLGDPEKIHIGRYRFDPAKTLWRLSEFKDLDTSPQDSSGTAGNPPTAMNTSDAAEVRTPEHFSNPNGCMVSSASQVPERRSDSTSLFDKFGWVLFFMIAFASGILISLFIF